MPVLAWLGGWVFYNATALPEDCRRGDVSFVVQPFTQLADSLGDPRAGNMVLLGAVLETTGALAPEPVDYALTRLVKSDRWVELDRRAIARGREAAHSPR